MAVMARQRYLEVKHFRQSLLQTGIVIQQPCSRPMATLNSASIKLEHQCMVHGPPGNAPDNQSSHFARGLTVSMEVCIVYTWSRGYWKWRALGVARKRRLCQNLNLLLQSSSCFCSEPVAVLGWKIFIQCRRASFRY